jgi:predicted nuclease of predicted toxin-antitoxin system
LTLSGLLIDENIPRDVKEWLKKKHFATVDVSKTDLKGSKDRILAEYSAKNHLALLTMDRGFGQLFKTFPKQKLTLIIIRAKPASPANIIKILEKAQPKIDLQKIEGKLVIITKSKIRITS